MTSCRRNVRRVEVELQPSESLNSLSSKSSAVDFLESAGFPPEPRNDSDRHVCVLREDGEFLEALTLGGVKKVETDSDGAGHRPVARSLVFGVEGHEPLCLEAPFGCVERARQRLTSCVSGLG